MMERKRVLILECCSRKIETGEYEIGLKSKPKCCCHGNVKSLRGKQLTRQSFS